MRIKSVEEGFEIARVATKKFAVVSKAGCLIASLYSFTKLNTSSFGGAPSFALVLLLGFTRAFGLANSPRIAFALGVVEDSQFRAFTFS